MKLRCLRLAALLAATLSLAGCSRTATTTKSEGPKTDGPKVDPWEAAAKRIRKDTDVGACRTALSQLSNDLANRPEVTSPKPLTADAEKTLAAIVPLAPTDATEVKSGTFSNLDPVYLADCLYLRDAARSLEVPGAPPAKLADLAFAWVCRQVYLKPWLLEGQLVPAVPPAYILRRGSGSGLERAYVFLALLQQFGIDACLIGPPDADSKPAGFSAGTGIPKGPFWAVGVRIGADIFLYDPWGERKLPSTLAQLKANPDPLKPWFEAKNPSWDVTPDDVKKASVFLAVPVSGLSERMAMLEERLKSDSGVKLAIKPAALRDRFADVQAKFWNPPTDRFAYGRITAGFLPLEEGGLDRNELPNRIHTMYKISLLPRSVFVMRKELIESAARERLMGMAAGLYELSFFTNPSPRERLQRGRFQEAARYLAEKQDSYTRGQERLRDPRTNETIIEWCKTASEMYARLSRSQSFDPADVPAAQAAINDFWQRYGNVAQLVVDQTSAHVGMMEATFLMALLKHEQAERLQARRELATGSDAERLKQEAERAWLETDSAWDTYIDRYGKDPGNAGRAGLVKSLADRAKILKGK